MNNKIMVAVITGVCSIVAGFVGGNYLSNINNTINVSVDGQQVRATVNDYDALYTDLENQYSELSAIYGDLQLENDRLKDENSELKKQNDSLIDAQEDHNIEAKNEDINLQEKATKAKQLKSCTLVDMIGLLPVTGSIDDSWGNTYADYFTLIDRSKWSLDDPFGNKGYALWFTGGTVCETEGGYRAICQSKKRLLFFKSLSSPVMNKFTILGR